jgi:hypothetical protein
MTTQRCILERFDRPPTEAPQPDPGPVVPPAALPEAPPVPAPDPAILAAERVADALDRIAQKIAPLRASAWRSAADAFARSAALMLPELAQAQFASGVAQTVARLVREADLDGASLHLSPDDHDNVLALLPPESPQGGGVDIRAVRDPRLAPGEAQLLWTDGGVDFDARRLADAALRHLEHDLAQRATQEMSE